MSATGSPAKRLMFVVTEDWYFMSHRLPLARAARDAGYEVLVATRMSTHEPAIAAEGFVPLNLTKLNRKGRNPFGELAAILQLTALYRHYRPAVVHHIAIKPVLYGAIAARLAGTKGVVNNLAGLGFVFSSSSLKARMFRPAILALLKDSLRQPTSIAIVQNSDDEKVLLTKIGLSPDRVKLIKGSGVDVLALPTRQETEPPTVILASRMIWDKGIKDFVAAAALLKGRGIVARFVLLGVPDDGNPRSVPLAVLEGFNKETTVEWWGHRSDMASVIAAAAIVCLPTTYGEGVPKILIEAAGGACAIVAYDVPGCREIVRNGYNGLLVPAGDITALAGALEELLASPHIRKKMGDNGRRMVEAEFTQDHVVSKTLAVYHGLAEQ